MRILFILILALSLFSGCAKKSGHAVVLDKEHIAAMKMDAVAPSESQKGRADSTSPASPGNNRGTGQPENEIVIDHYVMNANDRGTSRDPRAISHEQWIVKVRLIEGGRQFNVQTDSTQWEKLKVGDQVRVAYKEGKYTGTVWDAVIR